VAVNATCTILPALLTLLAHTTTMSDPSTQASASSYTVVLSGTHVTGKETIAVSLSTSLNCRWLKGEPVHASALRVARKQEERYGYNGSTVYGRSWFTKMQRIGLMSEVALKSDGAKKLDNHKDVSNEKPRMGCIALVTMYALRTPERDAIRDVMLANSVRAIFVILQITKDTLSGRTLGAEEPELAKKIMKEKLEDLREPLKEETDVLVVDSLQDVDSMTLHIEEMIRRQVVSS
jgi:gluconate kinase